MSSGSVVFQSVNRADDVLYSRVHNIMISLYTTLF